MCGRHFILILETPTSHQGSVRLSQQMKSAAIMIVGFTLLFSPAKI